MMEALDISEYDAKDLTGLDELVATQKPFVVRGLINHWPLKKMGEGSFERLSEYLLSHSEARKMVTHIGNYSSAEHIGYNDSMEMNFRTEELDLNSVLERIKHSYTGDTNELVYVSSVEIKKYFRNLGDENNVDLGDRETRAGIWIGSKNTVPTHLIFRIIWLVWQLVRENSLYFRQSKPEIYILGLWIIPRRAGLSAW